MKSQLAERLGAQAPQYVHRPPDVATLDAAADAVELAAAYGLTLDESQATTLEVGMGERADGSWAAMSMGDAQPRQNGKTDTIIARELYGLLTGETLLIHTAHQYSTAQEAFARTAPLFENYDDLIKLTKTIRYANGEQGIHLQSGARLLYKARSGGSGRGFAEADLVVFDEAQDLTGESVAALGGSRLAASNTQAWYAGTGGYSTSLLWWRMRRRAVRHDDGRFGYCEHTAETLTVNENGQVVARPVHDVRDRDLWALANPAYGVRITDEGLEDYRSQVGDALFARESLCVWEPCPDEEQEDGTVSMSAWMAQADPESRIVSGRSFGLDVSPDYRWATLAAAGTRHDRLTHLEAFDTQPETDWVLPAASALWTRWQTPIRIQLGSPASAFIDPFRTAGIGVTEVSATEVARSVGQLLVAIRNGTVRHMPSLTLDIAARNADVRPVGDVETWARRNAKVNITPIVAVTLALGGVPDAAEFYMPRRLR